MRYIRDWQLELDIPYTFQVKPAFEKAQHGVDFKPASIQNCYYDKKAGLLMLMPSTFTPSWKQNLIPASSINRQSQFWNEARRAGKSSTPATFLAKARPASQDPSLIELLILVAMVALTNSQKWVMETAISLDEDESFSFYIQSADDEYAREDDYFYLQWGMWGFKADTRGVAQLYRYTQLNQSPKLIYEWRYTDGVPVRESAIFTFVPCPPVGLLVIYSVRQSATMSVTASSVNRVMMSSQLVPLAEYATYTTYWSLTPASPLRVAINTRYDPLIAIERVRFGQTGTMRDKPFAVGYTSTNASVTPLVLYSKTQSATAELQTADGNSAWAGSADASVKLNLSTNDTRYSPFVWGYYVRIEPEYAQRNTTPISVRVTDLEFTRDDRGREEGRAEVFTDNANLIAMLSRGDTTYRLSYHDGTQYVVLSEGYAYVEKIDEQKQGYRARTIKAQLALRGWWSRLAETFLHAETAFDGVLFRDAINKLMSGAGYPPIPITDFPASLQSLRLPSAGSGDTSEGWRYAPRVGQSGLEILRTLMRIVNTITTEYRIRYDYTLNRFKFEEKPRPTTAIVLTADTRVDTIRYSRLQLEPLPPEANIIWVEGATKVDSDGERIVKILVNSASLNNPASQDYLGRVKLIRITADSLSTQDEVNKYADLIYEQIAHHRIHGTLRIPYPVPALFNPPVLIEIRARDNTIIATAYTKSITLAISTTEQSLDVEFDTQYLSDIREF